jgi:hypothetical protein
MDSNAPGARGKLKFGNHYSQVMLMYKLGMRRSYSADFAD